VNGQMDEQANGWTHGTDYKHCRHHRVVKT